jgi:hypothetical protein
MDMDPQRDLAGLGDLFGSPFQVSLSDFVGIPHQVPTLEDHSWSVHSSGVDRSYRYVSQERSSYPYTLPVPRSEVDHTWPVSFPSSQHDSSSFEQLETSTANFASSKSAIPIPDC